jgi:hypothetical protein
MARRGFVLASLGRVRNDNYPGASESIRNLNSVPGRYEVLEEHGKFRIVRFHPLSFQGYVFWVVNERGFLWEPADSLEAARAYLETDEAKEYQG